MRVCHFATSIQARQGRLVSYFSDFNEDVPLEREEKSDKLSNLHLRKDFDRGTFSSVIITVTETFESTNCDWTSAF